MSGTFEQINPFSRRESHNPQSVLLYKAFTIITWLLVVVSSFYYSFHAPHDDRLPQRTIWGQNNAHWTAFAFNEVIISIYWIVMLVLQAGYVWHLFSTNTEHVHAAASVGSHFIVNNLLIFGFLMLFVRSHFILGELLLIINFFNLSSLYFRHNTYARLIHTPVVSLPLALSFVSLYWNGAMAFGHHAENLPGRILANIAIWGILVYGLFFLINYKDYTMGFALSVICAGLGVGQFLNKAIAFQWIFAFTIMATLFVATLILAVPGAFGKEFSWRRERAALVEEDRERAPLLDEH